MKITQGKIARAQRVVLYGVESVGKTTLAANAPKPIFLDVEGGTAHLDVPRAEIGTWKELTEAVTECHRLDYGTVIIDSIDWAERLCIEAFLADTKKESIESIPYGKGWVQVAERMSRFLTSLDSLIDAGKNVVLIGHSQVKRVEPPDLMTAFDRYELKLAKQTAPLVKEWADELWFLQFKTKLIENESGKTKATGGKVRVIHTTHSAAYDAKTRSGLAEELPMEWASVAKIFQGSHKSAPLPASLFEEQITARQSDVNAFLLARGVITAGQTWRDASADYLARIAQRTEQFLLTVDQWLRSQQEAA
jgi:hypothetical protein